MIKDAYYRYLFSNEEVHTMKPVDAFKYAQRKKIDILEGPNYRSGKEERTFDGWGWHSGLLRTFKGPKDYRDYLRANGLIEAGNEGPLVYKEYDPPVWNEDMIRKAVGYGINIGGNLAEALLKGELDWPDEG